MKQKVKTFHYYSSNTDYSLLDVKVNEFIATLENDPIDIKIQYFNGGMIYSIIYTN